MLLLAVLFLPLLGFLAALFLPKDNEEGIKRFALIFTAIIFLISLGLIGPVLENPAQYAHVTDVSWMSTPAIRFHLGVDGLSLWLIILTTMLTPLAVLISWKHIDHRVKSYYAFLILLEFGVIGVFASLDLFLYYVFWEVGLVPMYFLIGIWGHGRRIYAAGKFFLYTMAGSVVMLVAIIYVYLQSGTFDYTVIVSQMQSGQLKIAPSAALLCFLAFFAAFAIKVPLWPLHTWLPDAYVEAPTAASVMMAAVLSKLGTYGLVRYCLPLFPGPARECAPWIAGLAIIGIVYGALVALVQPNMKRLIAYSSVSHLGFVVLGVFSFNQQGLDGAVLQMLNHGVSTAALFTLVGMLDDRRRSLEIKDYGGVSSVAPHLATAFLLTTLASIGLPLLNNFVGEFLVLQGAAIANFPWAVGAAIGVILSACYMLWLYQRVFFGKPSEDLKHHMPDITFRECVAVGPLLVLMVLMGIATGYLAPVSASNAKTLEQTKVNVNFNVKAQPASAGATHAD